MKTPCRLIGFRTEAPKSCSHRLRGGGSIRALDDISTRALDDIFESTRCHRPLLDTSRRENELGERTTRHSMSSYHHCPHLHFVPSPPLDAGKYAVLPQVGNLDRRPHNTPVNHRLLLGSCRHVSPTGRGPLNQEENIRCLYPKPSKRGGTPY